ncbi:NAD(+) diphosphatase [Uliginosibacterium sp. H1]|uniref:NAD(+) diphosphatase n=1 Tax=Uliginosibacterium sp. H1 TaxID=3114757 RepID=UPI002E1932FD|nr:NAD(+) diphosphatase [Uliginosibacterium sp. H1]
MIQMSFASLVETPADAWVFGFLGDDLIIGHDGLLPPAGALGTLPQASSFGIADADGRACIAQQWPADTVLPAGLGVTSLRAAYEHLPPPLYRLATRAKLLNTWDRQHRYCGACGTATELLAHEAARRCPACGLVAYPRLSPAVMVLIHRGDDILLARSPHFKPGVYSALAGFVEAGEDAEECIHREVMEEVGVSVGNLRWFSSQSWPFPHSLMLAFHADYAGGDIRPQPGEIEDALWVSKQALREGRADVLLPSPVSIAHRLIHHALD